MKRTIGLLVLAVVWTSSRLAMAEAPPMARLQLRANVPQTTFHLMTSQLTSSATGFVWARRGHETFHTESSTYVSRPLCTAPCDVNVPQGSYAIGLSSGQDPPLFGSAVNVDGPMELTGHYESRSYLRWTGAFVAVASLVAGLAIAFQHPTDCSSGSCMTELPHVGLGLGIIVGGVLMGVILGTRPDVASVNARTM